MGYPKLDNLQKLDNFLEKVQGRGFRIAQIATNSADDALDIVQDTMFKLVEKYSSRGENEWSPLFYKILHSRINDWHRRNKVRNRFRSWLAPTDDSHEDPIQTAKDEHSLTPDLEVQTERSMDKLQEALLDLPPRQQQVFLLRAWEGLNVKETALAMSCAEGSVKTHYSRAVHALRKQLGEHWP